jgi:hypothetical protein
VNWKWLQDPESEFWYGAGLVGLLLLPLSVTILIVAVMVKT